MTDILGSWPVTGHIELVNGAIVTGGSFDVAETTDPARAAISFVDSIEPGQPAISFEADLAADGRSLKGDTVVGSYAYFVTAMVEVVGSPSMLYRTISGTVLRKGGGTEDSGGQWTGGPLRPK